MAHILGKWDIGELSNAMANAISQRANNRFLRRHGDTVKFNGFWRDGDKQNVCAWLNKATWYDAKTGEGGSCKDFARVAFNMSLPEFMEHYGTRFIPRETPHTMTTKSANALAVGDVHKIWYRLCERDSSRQDLAARWLEHERGFINPRSSVGSGFANLFREDLELFANHQRHLIEQRLSLGRNLIVPLRSAHSSRVENLFFRALDPVSNEQKSRLLNGQGGWSNEEKSPRAFGFPHLIHDFPKLILCEGMADYFATECLLEDDDNFLSIGAANASALNNWAHWLCEAKYKGSVTILYQLDKDSSGKISPVGIGQTKAAQTLKILLANKVSASLFKWPNFLKHIDPSSKHQPNDIADVCKNYGSKAIGVQFMATLREVN